MDSSQGTGGRTQGTWDWGASTMVDLALELLDGSEGRGVSWLSPFKGQHLSRQARPQGQRLHLHPMDAV